MVRSGLAGRLPIAVAEREPAVEPRGDRLDHAVVELEREQRPRRRRQLASKRKADLGGARMRGGHGQNSGRAASAATMPKASGKVLGKTSASEAGTGTATSSCSSRPAKRTLGAAARAAPA